jgi:hypothetical protein
MTEMELWTAEDLDLLGPARLTLDRDGLGEVRFIAVEAGLDYRVIERGGQPAIEFSFDGFDEGDRINGRGWAVLQNESCTAASSFSTATSRASWPVGLQRSAQRGRPAGDDETNDSPVPTAGHRARPHQRDPARSRASLLPLPGHRGMGRALVPCKS